MGQLGRCQQGELNNNLRQAGIPQIPFPLQEQLQYPGGSEHFWRT